MMQYAPIITLYIIAALICFAGMYLVARQLCCVVSSGSVARTLLIMGLWAAICAMDTMSVSLDRKMIFTYLGYIPYTMLIPSWIQLMREYITRRPQGRHPLVLTAYGVFGAFMLLNWINPWNQFYRSVTLVKHGGLYLFSATYGVLFWIYVACAYAFLLGTFVWMIWCYRKGSIHRNHMVLMFVAVLFPALVSIPYYFKLWPFDTAALGFIPSCAVLFILYRNEFFDSMPLSRRNILDAMGDGVILLDHEKRVIEMNGAALEMLHLEEEKKAAYAKATRQIAAWPIHTEEEPIRFVQSLHHPALGERFYRVSITRVHTSKRGVQNHLLVLQDETTLHNVQQRILFLESYDEATGLYNRQYFTQMLEREMERCRVFPQTVALVCATVVNHRDYCYAYGNDFSNTLCRDLGRRLKSMLRRNDAISCFSEGEFFFFLRFDDPPDAVTSQLDSAMTRIFDQFMQPIEVAGVKLEVRFRSGIALCPKHTMSSAKLINLAHMARGSISKLTEMNYSVYQEAADGNYLRALSLEQGLHTALEERQMFLVYQPQIDIRTGRVVGVEGLLRWNHPGYGMIPPNEFIPIAEENGTIHSIGLWVIEQVVEQMEHWAKMGFSSLKVSANVSLNQLTNPHFADQVIERVERASIQPHNLELEITESLAMFPEALRYGHLAKLREHGIRLAMDDFGMGHSSLTYIKAFNLDTIKIDRALSVDIPENQISIAMLKSVRLLCEAIGTDMVVECIEHAKQLDTLAELGCYVVQGYVYSPPLQKDACTSYILSANG